MVCVSSMVAQMTVWWSLYRIAIDQILVKKKYMYPFLILFIILIKPSSSNWNKKNKPHVKCYMWCDQICRCRKLLSSGVLASVECPIIWSNLIRTSSRQGWSPTEPRVLLCFCCSSFGCLDSSLPPIRGSLVTQPNHKMRFTSHKVLLMSKFQVLIRPLNFYKSLPTSKKL